MGAVIVLVVVASLVFAVSLVVARHGIRATAGGAGGSPPTGRRPRARLDRSAGDRAGSHRPGRPDRPVRPARSPRPPRPAARRPGPSGAASANRARGGPRPAARRDPGPAPYRRSRDPLVALSAVEKRGRLARLDFVAFVEGSGHRADAAPAPADATPAPADAAPARALCRLQAPCQIVRVEQVRAGTVIDLVTFGPCRLGDDIVPAGSPLALGFGPVPPDAACQEIEAVMGYWEAIGAVVDLDVAESDQVTRYRFDCRDDGLALLVQAERTF